MADSEWPTRSLTVARLQLDAINPRLSPSSTSRAQRDIIQYLFDHEGALEVARSIARNGYFPNEPLLATREGRHYVVLEGNRRLAALKALREPQVLEGRRRTSVDRLLRARGPVAVPTSVPVTIAPDRAATDRQIAVRHVGTPVRRWRPQNKANFILAKLADGYDESALGEVFGFTATDIRDAREIRAIADLVRSLDLPAELDERRDSPDPAMLSTLHRVLDSPPGRAALRVEREAEDVFRVTTTKSEFTRGATRLVTDVLAGKQDSRSLNTHDDIESYFRSWPPDERVAQKRGTFAIGDVIAGGQPARPEPAPPAPRPRTRRMNRNVLPRSLKVRFGGARLVAIRDELVKLKRDEYPNAGAVLLRVFFELMVRDYLERTGEMAAIVERLRSKNALRRHGQPEMGQLVTEIQRVARERLEKDESERVDRALRREKWLEDLNAFVHQVKDLPTPQDLLAFWERMEPLFRLMLEEPHEDVGGE